MNNFISEIDTVNIYHGLISYEDFEMRIGDTRDVIEQGFGVDLSNAVNGSWYTLPIRMTDYITKEISSPIIVEVFFNNDVIASLRFKIGQFKSESEAAEALKKWADFRDIYEPLNRKDGSLILKCPHFLLDTSIVKLSDDIGLPCYGFMVELKPDMPNWSKVLIPKSEKFSRVVNYDGCDYKISIVTKKHHDRVWYFDCFLNNMALKLSNLGKSPTFDDKVEQVNFVISKITDEGEESIGGLGFIYASVIIAYLEGRLAKQLKSINRRLDLLASAYTDRHWDYGDAKSFSHSVLYFDKDYSDYYEDSIFEFEEEDYTLRSLILKSCTDIFCNYEGVPAGAITVMDILPYRDVIFDANVPIGEGCYINYNRGNAF